MDIERYTAEKVTKGTCQTMCPVAEIHLREKEGLLHPFETVKNKKSKAGKPVADVEHVVKTFSRPAAGRTHPSPSDIRPFPVLLRTVNYLLASVAGSREGDWMQIYDFVFDRLRAVRQDAVLQALQGPELIPLLERIIRFHVYAGYRLCELPLAVYDPTINRQHLLECLKQLLRAYEDTPGQHPHQAVFEAVYLLHNLGSAESLQHGLELPPSLRLSQHVKSALAVSFAFLASNYVRFFRQSFQLPSLLCFCAVHAHFNTMRSQALRMLSVAFSSKACQYPVSKLLRSLHTTRGPLMELLAACGLVTQEQTTTAQHVCFVKPNFRAPEQIQIYRQKELDEKLHHVDLAQFLLGEDTS